MSARARFLLALSVLLVQLGCGGGGGGSGGGGSGGGGSGGGGGGRGGGGSGGATGPTIGAQPQNQSVTVGQSANFSVSATGNGALGYQWRKNGTPIAGATTSSLTFTAELADSGSTYQVAVSDSQGTVTSNSATLSVVAASYVAFALAKESSLALASDGTLYGWGAGLAIAGGSLPAKKPTVVVSNLKFTAISAEYNNACGLTAAGQVYCWGDNDFGQMGDGTKQGTYTPTLVTGGLTFTAISVGGDTACGLVSSGAAYCWGLNNLGQVGDGANSDRSVPTAVAGGLTFKSLSTGLYHSCAITQANKAYCWGGGASGVLGNGKYDNQSTPVAVSGGVDFVSVVTSGSASCALTPGGVAYCWGNPSNGELGIGPPGSDNYAVPHAVSGGLTFSSLAGGLGATCGIAVGASPGTSSTYCWGQNTLGDQLGNGTTSDALIPTLVSGTTAFTHASLALETLGSQHGCALDAAGKAYCWGANQSYEVGDGTQSDRIVPTAVLDP